MARTACASAALKVDTVVIGAGVVGLAVARALTSSEILIVDRASSIGSETSSRNSEVIHAGLYYPAKSKKARFCVEGKKQLYKYCETRNVPYRKCGKLIVATEPQHGVTLQSLQQQAQQNGVLDTEILSRHDVLAREPSLSTNIQSALWSPSTGIVDSHTLMINLLADAENDGSCTLALRTNVTGANIIGSRIHLHFADGTWLSCRSVVNCAGLWASSIAELLHKGATPACWQPPKQYFARGTYVRSTTATPAFSHLVYPVPDPSGGLGVHATIDLAGQTKFGPDVEWLDADTQPDDIDYAPDPNRVDSFYQSIRTYWPDLSDGALTPDYTGVRPKLAHPRHFSVGAKLPALDFAIVDQSTHGVSGLVHLFGIESPGLTSSMAIADYVAEIVNGVN